MRLIAKRCGRLYVIRLMHKSVLILSTPTKKMMTLAPHSKMAIMHQLAVIPALIAMLKCRVALIQQRC